MMLKKLLKKKMKGFLVTIDTEKAFDSLYHSFLISALEKYGFGKNLKLWINISIRDQESCVINGGEAPSKVTQFQLFYLF